MTRSPKEAPDAPGERMMGPSDSITDSNVHLSHSASLSLFKLLETHKASTSSLQWSVNGS